MTFLILGLLSLSALALLGAIFFLYRYLMRSHLFPQLPRVWRVEKMRFFMCSIVFVVCFAAFLITGWLNNQPDEVDESVIYQTQPTQNQPSFDGGPPASPERERVLPPRTEEGDTVASPPPISVIGSEQDRPITEQSPASPPQTSGSEPAKPEPVKPEPVKPEPAKPEPTKPEPVKPEPVKPDKPPVPDKPEPVAPDENKPPLPQPKPYVPDPADLPADTRNAPPGQTREVSQPGLPVPTAATPAAATESSGQFSVCVASYATEAGAQSELKNYQSLGQARIVAADIPGKGRWYRICINQYATQAEAQAASASWRNSGAAKGAFVVRLP